LKAIMLRIGGGGSDKGINGEGHAFACISVQFSPICGMVRLTEGAGVRESLQYCNVIIV
jgi:hypothetical protein